jgi:ABC-type siderophore export system fused ATPase/permease subunit
VAPTGSRPEMQSDETKSWWKDPAKIAAVVTTIALIGTFIYSRERQLLILSERILTFEERATKRVEEFNEKVEGVKQLTLLNERAIQTMNERIVNDESLIRENSNRITRMEAIIDRLFPQGSSTPIRK